MKLLQCDTEKGGQRHNRGGFTVAWSFYSEVQRGRAGNGKIKESSKGRSAFKGYAVYTVHPQGFLIHSHAGA